MPQFENHLSYLETIRSAGFGHVAQQIAEHWDKADARLTFQELLIDRSRGSRIGFPPDVFKAIVKLYTIYCFAHGCVDEWSNLYFEDHPS